ncbi:MAG TPA: hypothetical protein VIZ00_14020 [Streptosporangiaceae bacterium]
MVVSNLLARARRAVPEAAPGRAALTIGAVALATAGLAACSSSSGPAASSSSPTIPASSSPAAPASSSPATTASAPPGSLDACTAVTTAQVGTAMGATVETTTGSVVDGNSACTYILTILKGDDASVQVVVGDVTAFPGFTGQVSVNASPPGSSLPVGQLGQEAAASSAGVAVLTAKHAILIRNERAAVGKLSNDVSLAKILVAHLG